MDSRLRRHALALALLALAGWLLVDGLLPAVERSRRARTERETAEAERDARAAALAGTELWITGLEEGDPDLTARARDGLRRAPDLPGEVRVAPADDGDVDAPADDER